MVAQYLPFLQTELPCSGFRRQKFFKLKSSVAPSGDTRESNIHAIHRFLLLEIRSSRSILLNPAQVNRWKSISRTKAKVFDSFSLNPRIRGGSQAAPGGNSGIEIGYNGDDGTGGDAVDGEEDESDVASSEYLSDPDGPRPDWPERPIVAEDFWGISMRLVPAAPGELLGVKRPVDDSALVEWPPWRADAGSADAGLDLDMEDEAAAPRRVVTVPDDFHGVHAALRACGDRAVVRIRRCVRPCLGEIPAVYVSASHPGNPASLRFC